MTALHSSTCERGAGQKNPNGQAAARYFAGKDLGHVTALSFSSFHDLHREMLAQPVRLDITREEYGRLPKSEQGRAKQVRYLTAAAFNAAQCNRRTENAVHCNLIALDVDDAGEARRLMNAGWSAIDGYRFVVWHTASSSAICPRLRILVEADRIPLLSYGDAVRAVGSMLGMEQITTESTVAVQAMYLPTTFKHDEASPILAANMSGDAFRTLDLMDFSGSPETAPDGRGVGDLDHYAAPDSEVTLALAEEMIRFLDADMSRRDWLQVAMGLRHQFPDESEAAYQIFDRWSATAKAKYSGSDDTRASWESIKPNPRGRSPVTIHTVRKKAVAEGWTPTNAPLKGDKRNIILPGGEISITSAAEQIFSLIAENRGMFYRGGKVHEVVVQPDGRSRLEPVGPAQFRSRLERYGSVFVWRVGANGERVLKPATCPEESAKALLESRPACDRLPNVVMLSACPVLADDGDGGSVLGAGWHKHSDGIFITGGAIPTVVVLKEAIRSLANLVSDFDFASPGDRARALGSLIAPALRFGSWLKDPLPIDIGEADASQSGKTYRQKVVAAIYRETCNVVVQRSGGVGGLDESLSQKLVDGRPFILLDNLRARLDSPYLESILTAPSTMPARVPHRGEIQVDPRAFVFQLTSNGVETTRDLANRAAIVRIRKRPRAYVFQAFAEGDLHSHVTANQPYYLGCVFAVIQEWVLRGRQRTAESRHDFREWAQTLDWIVQNIFGAAPLLDGHDDARERVSDPRKMWLRSLCLALRDAKRTDDLIATQIAEFSVERGLLPPNVRPDADESAIARRIGSVMAATFGSENEVEIDGFTIHRARRYSPTAQKEIPAYRFGGPDNHV